MYVDFSVTETNANFSDKTITINTNFILDKTTVNFNTVKFFITIDGENKLLTDYVLTCDGKNMKIELNEYPYEDDQYYIYVKGVRDRLGRELAEPYMKTISFSPNIATKLIIQSPEDMAAIKSKKVHVEVTILDDDEYTLKLIDDASDIVLFSESDLTEALELSDNTVRLEVSTDKKFYKKEHILFGEHDATSSNPYKVSADKIARIGNTLSFDLLFYEDQQYFIRARLESREDEHYFGEWSDPIGFIVKAESLLDPTENYLEEMLFSDTIFADEYKELELLSKTDESCTDQEFYMEFNKPVKLDKDMLTTEDGLIYIGKAYLIRRDL